jgi:hypothetical protein
MAAGRKIKAHSVSILSRIVIYFVYGKSVDYSRITEQERGKHGERAARD